MGLFLLSPGERLRYQRIEAFSRCSKSTIKCLLSPSPDLSQMRSLSRSHSQRCLAASTFCPAPPFLFLASPGLRWGARKDQGCGRKGLDWQELCGWGASDVAPAGLLALSKRTFEVFPHSAADGSACLWFHPPGEDSLVSKCSSRKGLSKLTVSCSFGKGHIFVISV